VQLPRLQGLRARLSYANVIATLALFFALTGGAMAANKYLQATDPITTGDLAGSTYGNPLIAPGKITSSKIADGAITSAKFDGSAKAPDSDKLDGKDSTDFLGATAVPSKIIERANDSGPIQPGDPGATNASCDSGEQVVGGGVYLASNETTLAPEASAGDRVIVSAPPAGDNLWFGEMINGSSSPKYVVVTVLCAVP
jgi:hypothetical protein